MLSALRFPTIGPPTLQGILRPATIKYGFEITSNKITGVLRTIAGSPVIIKWGDGTSTSYVSNTDKSYSHTYASSGNWRITFDNPDTLTRLTITSNSLAVLKCKRLPRNINYFDCRSTNSALIGDVADLPDTTLVLLCDSTNSVLVGDVAKSPKNIVYYDALNTLSTINAYTAGRAWASNMQRVRITTVAPGGLDSTEVDNILNDLSMTTWTGGKIVSLLGTCAPRTSASDYAVTVLNTAGVTVLTNS